MRRRDGSFWMTILIGLLGFVVGFFLGEFFVHLSRNVDFLSFLSFLGYSTGFGLDATSLNLIFARVTLGFVINFSVTGVVVMVVFLAIYFKRR